MKINIQVLQKMEIPTEVLIGLNFYNKNLSTEERYGIASDFI